MRAGRLLGVLGGTFDPIHFGHLDAAEAARAALALDEVLVMPAMVPPHRSQEPRAGAYHRFAMAALAIDGREGLRVSDLELVHHRGPSYTIDTLRALHAAGWHPSQLFFIVGADAFAEIATWHEYPDVLDTAHFAVVARPGTTLDTACARAPDVRTRMVTAPNQGTTGSTRVFLVPAATRDISATEVRARLAARSSIADLVPAAVARHILAHQLYIPADRVHAKDEDSLH